MINVKDVSATLGLDITTIKRDLKQHFVGQFERTSPGKNGWILIPPQTVRELLRKRRKDYKHQKATIAQEKGGEGKTSLTLQVAIRKAKLGCKVLVIDLDPESNSTIFLLKDNHDLSKLQSIYEIFKDNLSMEECIVNTRFDYVDLLPAKGRMRKVDRLTSDKNPKLLLKEKLREIEDKYDLILFDLPPTFTRLVASAYLSSDLIILPCTPSSFSLEGIFLTLEDIQEDATQFETLIPEIKILINKFNPSRKASNDLREELGKRFSSKLLPFTIKESADILNLTNNGMSIFEGKCSPDIKNCFDELSSYICPLINTGPYLEDSLHGSSELCPTNVQ